MPRACWNKILRKQLFLQFPQWKTLLLFSGGFPPIWLSSTSSAPGADVTHHRQNFGPGATGSVLDASADWNFCASSLSSYAKLSSLSRASASDIYLRNFWIWETLSQNIQLLKNCATVKDMVWKKIKKSDYWNEWTRWETEQCGRGHWPAWLCCSAVGKVPYHPC